ncbi:MAG: hypothetical protein ABIP97_01025, partial [Chthoniobacterales bacterium]
MRPNLDFGFRLFLTLILGALIGADQGLANDLPKFEGNSIPLPPEQSKPWTPPTTKIPPDGLSAIAELFKQGLADPRGCEYREIEVVTGTCSGFFQIIKTHGWVLPSQDKQKFGVCWSGLVYPLVSVSAKAGLHADIEEVLKRDAEQLDEGRHRYAESEKQREDQTKRKGQKYDAVNWPLRWNTQAISEPDNVAYNSMHPIKAVLLFRAGETELAEKIWQQWFGAQQQENVIDPYLPLAQNWVWALFDRALCAHMRGDDHLALLSAEVLLPIQKTVEDKAAERNIPRPQNTGNEPRLMPYISFLGQLPALIADEERRLQEGVYTPVLQINPPPPPKDYIADLIRDLEHVSARQQAQPGGVHFTSDPIAKALIDAGTASVEPLLLCLENDTRLTRSVQYGRDFFPARTILGVPEVAYAILQEILQTRVFNGEAIRDRLDPQKAQGHKEVADNIRAYWGKYKNQPIENRWYEILNDDTSSPRQWLEAAANIVQSTDLKEEYATTFGIYISSTSSKPDVIPPMKGESLRAKTNPSVSELFVKRMKGLSVSMNQSLDTNLEMKTQLGLTLAKWDGEHHIEDLRSLSDIWKARMANPKAGDSREQALSKIVIIYKARILAKDPQALSDYAAWVVAIPRENLGYSLSSLFDIIWQHPEEPVIQQTAEQLFGNKNSPWVPLYGRRGGDIGGLLHSPLIGMPAFQKELFRGLNDKSTAGSIILKKNQNESVSIDADESSIARTSYYLTDPFASAIGLISYFRMCDLYAYEISQSEGAPKFQLYWPEKKRNAAVAECIRFLKKYGDLYQYQRDANKEGDPRKADIHFPQLDHPATPKDLENNAAIFVLRGKNRLWKMPNFPMKASWKTL